MKRLYSAFLLFAISFFISFSPNLISQIMAEGEYVNLVIWDVTDHISTDKYIDNWGPNLYLENFLPGETREFTVNLKNISTTSAANLSFKIFSSVLTLDKADYFSARITDLTSSSSSDWFTLHQLLSDNRTQLPFVLQPQQSSDFKVEVRMSPTAPSSLANFTTKVRVETQNPDGSPNISYIDDLRVEIYGTNPTDTEDQINIQNIGLATGTFSDPTPTPTPTSTPTTTITPPPTSTPTPTSTPDSKYSWFTLTLLPECSTSPKTIRNWVIKNNSRNSVPYTWKTLDGSQSGSGTINSRGLVRFSTNYINDRSAVVKLEWGGKYFFYLFNPEWKCRK